MTDEIYGWFFNKRCNLWNQAGKDGRRCPILEIQRANYREIPKETAVYYPEAISGNPSSNVVFLGINPGQTGVEPDETESQQATRCRKEAEEIASCPNSMANHSVELEAYIQNHLEYNLQHPTERIVAGAARIVQKMWECSRGVALSMLTLMNVAHCKCPDYTGNVERADDVDESIFWDVCGAQTLRILSLLKPRAVVCLGGQVQRWVMHVHNEDRLPVYAPWKLDADMGEPWYGRTMPLVNMETGTRIPLVMSYHPTQGGGRFTRNEDGIAASLRKVVFGS